jgi:hypothetical protein
MNGLQDGGDLSVPVTRSGNETLEIYMYGYGSLLMILGGGI